MPGLVGESRDGRRRRARHRARRRACYRARFAAAVVGDAATSQWRPQCMAASSPEIAGRRRLEVCSFEASSDTGATRCSGARDHQLARVANGDAGAGCSGRGEHRSSATEPTSAPRAPWPAAPNHGDATPGPDDHARGRDGGRPTSIPATIDTVTPRDQRGTAVKTCDPKRRAEPVWDPAVHAKSWRAVWAYSRRRAKRDNVTLSLQENKACAVVAGDKAARTPRFIATRNGASELDET